MTEHADRPETPRTETLSRREALRALGWTVASVPLVSTLACGGSGGSDDDAGFGTDSGSGSDASSNTDASTPTSWATGGTASIVDADAYPDPFVAGSSACALTCQATIGPCHTTSPERADVSDGWDGLPVRLALKVVDESCTPIENAIVEIWHTNYRGIYSGRISTMCNSDEEDRAAAYFRGYVRTDAEGRVDFDTVFPGWYSGRCVHIHFRIQMGSYDGADSASSTLVSQLFFPDELVRSIFAGEPLYDGYGTPDTFLGDDNVVGGEEDPSPYVCDVARMSDGVMLASKTIVILSSSGSLCTMSGAGGGGMPPR